MSPRELRTGPVAEALLLLPAKMTSPAAEVLLLAIGLQESRLTHRRQIGGPARGLWQFERGGGVAGVLRHPVSRDHAVRVCDARGVAPVPEQVYQRLEHDDVLAAAFARLLLFTDPARLPGLGDEEGAWQLYLRTWRPGAHSRGDAAAKASLRQKWAKNYGKALEAVQ